MIRFEGLDNKIHYGEPLDVKEIDINNINNLKAKIVKGDIFSKNNEVTNEIVGVKKVNLLLILIFIIIY